MEGEVALKNGEPRDAIKLFTEANALLDTWLGHFDLGRAYLDAGAFPQADSEFDRCIKRRGEALALFLDEEPTYGVLPARVLLPGPRSRRPRRTRASPNRTARISTSAASPTEDPLLPDVRRRALR